MACSKDLDGFVSLRSLRLWLLHVQQLLTMPASSAATAAAPQLLLLMPSLLLPPPRRCCVDAATFTATATAVRVGDHFLVLQTRAN